MVFKAETVADGLQRRYSVVMNRSYLVEVWPLIRLKVENMLAFDLASPRYICPVALEINEPGRSTPSFDFYENLDFRCYCVKGNKSTIIEQVSPRPEDDGIGQLFPDKGPFVVVRITSVLSSSGV